MLLDRKCVYILLLYVGQLLPVLRVRLPRLYCLCVFSPSRAIFTSHKRRGMAPRDDDRSLRHRDPTRIVFAPLET